jgi:hypothetical protein
MAKDKQHKGSPKGVSGAGSTARSGARQQGPDSAATSDARSPSGGSAQLEQGGDVSQQDGAGVRDDAEMLDDDAQSGSSPRARSDSPDAGKGGERT